jgi:hypothetical protein
MVADLRLITTTVPRLSTAVVAAQAKEVLVDWGEHALGHDGAVRWLWVRWGQETECSWRVVVYGRFLAGVEGEDVLVAADGDDSLQDEAAQALDWYVGGVETGVFLWDAVDMLSTVVFTLTRNPQNQKHSLAILIASAQAKAQPPITNPNASNSQKKSQKVQPTFVVQ